MVNYGRFISEQEFKELKQDLKVSNLSAYAASTRKNLKVQWESFLLFCIYFNMQYLPAETCTLQLYAQFLSRSFKSVESIRNYLSGIRTMHMMLGYSINHLNNFLINLSLKGLTRLKQHMVRQAEPITPLILSEIYGKLNMNNADDSVYWCLFLFAFFLVARKSNLVPTNKSDIEAKHCLLRKDITMIGENLCVTMRWSKTIQFGQRLLKTPLLKLQSSILCPVNAYQKMLEFIPITRIDQPLFVLKNEKIVTYYMFQKRFRYILSELGYDSSKFSSHSFRRGFATFAFRSNIAADEIQILGDWHSDVYKRYISLSIDDKLDILQSVKDKLQF